MIKLDKFKVIPVVVLNNEEDAKRKLDGLRNGRLFIAEITFRTSYALEGIKYAITHYPDILIGAGTVINKKQCRTAIKSGCKFIVSPGLSKEVAKCCKENNIPYFPGCATPTEIMEAIELDLNIIKYFPAQIYGGLNAINALGSAFPQVKFIPTGGINISNLKEYLLNDKVQAVGGSWMMKDDIKENCLAINETIKEVKK